MLFHNADAKQLLSWPHLLHRRQRAARDDGQQRHPHVHGRALVQDDLKRGMSEEGTGVRQSSRHGLMKSTTHAQGAPCCQARTTVPLTPRVMPCGHAHAYVLPNNIMHTKPLTAAHLGQHDRQHRLRGLDHVCKGDGHLGEGHARADVANGVEQRHLQHSKGDVQAEVVTIVLGVAGSKGNNRSARSNKLRLRLLHSTAEWMAYRRERLDVGPGHLRHRLQPQRPQHAHEGRRRHCSMEGMRRLGQLGMGMAAGDG